MKPTGYFRRYNIKNPLPPDLKKQNEFLSRMGIIKPVTVEVKKKSLLVRRIK
jgi:hypothetical protein